MSADKDKTGVVLCNCGGRNFKKEEIKSLQTRLQFSSGENLFIQSDALCTKEGAASLKETMSKKGIKKLVFAGCTAKKSGETASFIAEKCRIAPSNILEVTVPAATPEGEKDSPFGMKEELIRSVVKGINKHIGILEGMETFATKKVPLHQGVLVVGGGSAAQAAADVLTARGYSPILLEKEDELLSLQGQLGSFTATLSTGGGVKQADCGAVILASGFSREKDAWTSVTSRFASPHLVPLSKLADAAAELPRIPSGRSVGIVLDLDVDEGKASSETACRTALQLQRQDGLQVYLFCRDIRVGSLPLEELYDDARDRGVVIVKYENQIRISGTNGTTLLSCTDAVLGNPIQVACDLAGISLYGVAAGGDTFLSEITGVDLDSLGRLQGNNIHLFATGTNIPGIFVAGGCRGNVYPPEAEREGRAAAGEVDLLLSQKELKVELSEAKVDADKCALCLTCIRACPHNAMKINREESVAVSVPEVCQRCGICAGECPAKAITLPAYTDDILLAQLG